MVGLKYSIVREKCRVQVYTKVHGIMNKMRGGITGLKWGRAKVRGITGLKWMG